MGVASFGLLIRPLHRGVDPASSAGTPSDPASPNEAARMATAVVEQSLLKGPQPAARVLAVTVKRVGRAVERPRYEAEVVAEAPPGSRSTTRSEYLVTLQYEGDGKWRVEGMTTKAAAR
jgi:hypothetical protein